jgi:hypothetical protein
MLAFMAQFGAGLHPGDDNLLAPLGALLLAACGGGLILGVLQRVVPRARRTLRFRLARRRRQRATVSDERRARATMDELCPHGWRAQITLYGASDKPPDGRADRRRDWVGIDWAAFEDGSGRVEIVRRVWAPTIAEALDAMVADRQTDETLEHIEQSALADGAPWPDL